jgi:uncharacterized protein (DUF2267 family)
MQSKASSKERPLGCRVIVRAPQTLESLRRPDNFKGAIAMSINGLEIFDTTIQKTNSWLQDLMAEMRIHNRHAAYQTLRAVLHAMRDRLNQSEIADMASQMPMLLRGMFYEGWSPARKRIVDRSMEGFLSDVMSRYDGKRFADPKTMAEGVFAVLSNRISFGEISDIRHLLPRHIRDLWPQERALT